MFNLILVHLRPNVQIGIAVILLSGLLFSETYQSRASGKNYRSNQAEQSVPQGRNPLSPLITLELDRPISRELAGGAENHAYQISLGQGQYSNLIIQQQGIDVVVQLLGNEDQADGPLRSGLALAGANLDKDADEDAILTALEASGLNLWSTTLVVLSACDTGLGEVRNGEGVYGLRRAFVLAGAESLVMSLWPVTDYSTRNLMIGYYRNLKLGMGRGGPLDKSNVTCSNATVNSTLSTGPTSSSLASGPTWTANAKFRPHISLVYRACRGRLSAGLQVC
jgi:hypothetical protein